MSGPVRSTHMSMVRRAYVTTRLHEVFSYAHNLADLRGHDISFLHLTHALLREEVNVAAQMMCAFAPREILERDVEALLPPLGAARAQVAERAWSTEDEALLREVALES